MNWQYGIATSVLVAASIPLIAAFQSPVADSDASVQASELAQKPAHDPALEAPVANQNLNLPGWAYTPRGAGMGLLPADDEKAPEAHPAMPPIVAEGNKAAGVAACSSCHLSSGVGGPESANLAGLPRGYMLKQLEDFKADERHNSVPGMAVTSMIPVAAKISPEDAEAAVDYFASLKPAKLIKVIETDVVPKTHAENWILTADTAGGTEPIGNRVIEVRNPAGGYIVYVPNGTLHKGEQLVNVEGEAGAQSCTGCHGRDLKGAGNVPAIAGRSPSALARQLYDFQSGARKDSNPSLSHLTDTDIVAITGYLASLEP